MEEGERKRRGAVLCVVFYPRFARENESAGVFFYRRFYGFDRQPVRPLIGGTDSRHVFIMPLGYTH